MGFKTVVVEIETEVREFPLGTEVGLFRFELWDLNNHLMSFLEVDNTGASFPDVPDGATYIAKVSRQGVEVSQQFDVPAESLNIAVPVVVTVTF